MDTPTKRKLMLALSQAMALKNRSKLDEATRFGQDVVRRFPDHPEAHELIGLLKREASDLAASAQGYCRAIVLSPDYKKGYLGMGSALADSKLWEDGLRVLKQARRVDPGYAFAHLKAATVEQDLQDPKSAVRSLRRTLILVPTLIDAVINHATALVEMGSFKDAAAGLNWAYFLDPANDHVFRRMADLNGKTDNPKLKERIDQRLTKQDLPVQSVRSLNMAAAKIARDSGDASGCFAYLAASKRARAEVLRQTAPSGRDEAGRDASGRDAFSRDEAHLALCRELFDRAFFADTKNDAPDTVNSGPTPIFILGMPRSGTTLTEQVLASHSRVHAAGELPAMSVIQRQLFDANRPDESRALIGKLSPGHLQPLGLSYIRHIHAMAPQAPFITDKTPHNFELIWLIRRLFPKAPIIHCVRNPVDTCLSIYFQDFIGGHPYANDLRTLGRHYRFYSDLMAHWNSVLPTPLFIQDYEAMVQDPETRIRALLEYCGLPFEPACLEFHSTDRSVRTASATQVREGIYKTSSGRWRTYEPYLGPLLEELGPLVPQAVEGNEDA